MKSRTFILCFFAYFTALSVCCGQAGISAYTRKVLLDDVHPAIAQRAVDRAVSKRRYDQIFVAMHNLDIDVQKHCLDRVESIPKISRAQLLAKILLDDEIVFHKNRLFAGSFLGQQTILQRRLEEMSYKILKLPPPGYHGLLTQNEIVDLATRLHGIE